MQKKLIVYGLFCLFSVSAYADTARENETLARIIHVLDSLQPLIQKAEQEQDTGERVQFDYTALRQDITQVKAGIERKFAAHPLEPRVIKPIQGDYLSIRARQKQ